MSASSAPLPAGRLAAPVTRPVPTWTRLAATGLFLTALAPLTMLASGVVAGLDLGGDIAFIAIAALVPAVTALLVLRFGTWAKVLGVVVSVLFALAMFWVAFGIGYPTSFGDFAPAVSMVVGVAAGLIGSIAAIVAKRRGNAAPTLAGGERQTVLALVGLVALAAVLSLGLDLTTGGTVVADAGAASTTMHDFSFEEETIVVAAGEEAQVVVHNSDPFMHDFAVPALGIEPVLVAPGEEALVTITDAEPGTYTVYCTLHSDTDAPDGGENGMATTGPVTPRRALLRGGEPGRNGAGTPRT